MSQDDEHNDEEAPELGDATIDRIATQVALVTLPLPELAHIRRDGVDVEGRDIYLFGEITENDGGEFAQTIRYLERISTDPVRVWISSPGGDTGSEFMIHDAIRACLRDVYTIGIGEVASAALLILVCGHRRFVTESTVAMAHQARVSGEKGIGLRAAQDRRAWEDWTQSHWVDLMARYVRGGRSFWKNAVDKGGEHWRIGGQAIVDAGMADALWNPRGSTS